MKMKKYLAIAAVATMFAACTNEEVTLADSLKDIPITLSTNVADLVVSRTIDNDGKLVDADLGLFVTTENAQDKYKATNMKWTGDADGNWTSADGTLLFEGTNKQTAYAYSPYVADAVSGTITVDLATQTDYLYAASTTLTSNQLALNMSHRLSKVTVNITETGTEIADDEIASISLANVPVSATWTLVDNTLTNAVTTGSILTGDDYSALLLPGTISISIVVAMESGRTFRASATAPENGLVVGTAYTINLKVGRDAVTIGEVRVADWGEPLTIDGGVAMEDLGYSYDSQTNTYTVWNANGLSAWRTAALNDLSTNLILDADITMPTVADGESNWERVGTGTAKYTGTIDGNNHTISGLQMNATSNNWVSFAGYVDASSTIKNLTFADVNISGQQYVGVVAGISKGTITNCHVTSGIVTGKNNMTAGIVGSAGGTVTGCTNAASVNGGSVAGGIAGNTDGGSSVVAACSNTGVVSATGSSVGGIVGGSGNSVIGCWTVDTNEKDLYGAVTTGKNGIGNEDVTPNNCYSGDAATINDKVEAMNTALGITYGYQWQAGTDGYPTLVKVTE